MPSKYSGESDTCSSLLSPKVARNKAPAGLNCAMFEVIDEKEQFERFRSAYKRVTGEWLRRVRKSERPDYICTRPQGSFVGIEFTLITRDPERSFWDYTDSNIEFMHGADGVLAIQEAIMRKELKRLEPDWQLANSSILVLSTPDCPVAEMEFFLDESVRSDLEENGFSEIWIADHTETEAYGTIELFGITPGKWWGRHGRPWTGKPFG